MSKKLRVSFNLDDADLEHFAEVAQQTQALARSRPAEQIIAGAREVLEKARQAQAAGFVKERYSRLEAMLDMVDDAEWRLEAHDRQRVLNALACFSSPAVPASATELLDHAIMIELVSRDLQHDLDAYAAFSRFRTARANKRQGSPAADRSEWLEQRRANLQSRMHQRRKRDLETAGSAVRKLFSLFGM